MIKKLLLEYFQIETGHLSLFSCESWFKIFTLS